MAERYIKKPNKYHNYTYIIEFQRNRKANYRRQLHRKRHRTKRANVIHLFENKKKTINK